MSLSRFATRLTHLERGTQRWLIRLLVVTSVATLVPLDVARAQPAIADESAEKEARYAAHMQNGIKLYESKDWPGAIVEFEAAYALFPRSGPLINIALCHRDARKYPKAAAALERVLREHGATLDEAQRASAEKALSDMTGLIAHVVLDLAPKDAVVRLDGEIEVLDATGKLALSPGEHVVDVSREGHVSRQVKVTIASGQTQQLEVKLSPVLGTLSIEAAKPTTPIELDGKLVGVGAFTGPTPVGTHTVKLVGEREPMSVVVDANKPTTLSFREPAPPPTAPLAPSTRGFYVLGQAGVFFTPRHPTAYESGGSDFADGANLSLRGGYRVHEFLAFEAMFFEYGNVTAATDDPKIGDYSFSSFRTGVSLRAMSPGKLVRFVGTFGGGIAYDRVDFEKPSPTDCDLPSGTKNELCQNSSGFDFVLSTEVGAEFNVGGVLMGAGFRLLLNGTKGVEDIPNREGATTLQNPFDNEVLPLFGPIIHLGYAFF